MAVANAKKLHANPVYAGYFADPFVWKVNGTYYAIGTGASDASGQALGKAFTVLQSSDFYDWQFAANALLRPDPALGNSFWAPEVAYHDGRFYLYYSVGHGDKDHQLRVAESESPQGPYRDMGVTLIDPKTVRLPSIRIRFRMRMVYGISFMRVIFWRQPAGVRARP